MPATHKALQLAAPGADFTIVEVNTPTPGPDEVSIRLRATALNPINVKQRDSGLMVSSWPVILGSEGSGVVEAVGSAVTQFKPGDEVIALGPSFQEVLTVTANKVGLKPKSLSFEQSAALSGSFGTAACVVYTPPSGGLGIPLPFLPGAAEQTEKTVTGIRSVLVLGGSAAVGAATVQLLRLSLGQEVSIFTTSSPQHHARLTDELGATKAFDRNSKTLVQDVRAASPGGKGVDLVIDATGALAGNSSTLEALSTDGQRAAVIVLTGKPVEIPEGIRKIEIIFLRVFEQPGAEGLIAAIQQLVDSGKYKQPYKEEVVGQGLADIPKAVQKLAEGVSGVKLIVKY